MRGARRYAENAVKDIGWKIEHVLDDTAHDLRIIADTVKEIRDDPDNRVETIDIALGLIDELIATLEA